MWQVSNRSLKETENIENNVRAISETAADAVNDRTED